MKTTKKRRKQASRFMEARSQRARDNGGSMPKSNGIRGNAYEIPVASSAWQPGWLLSRIDRFFNSLTKIR